ncbi:MAG: hypothetical protein NT142_07830 [Planctomycetota bacterium]|nr:hypothetical protein [Planctomycetota bacterium]
MDEPTDAGGRWMAVLLALPNFGVIGVWSFTVANEWYLYTWESVPVLGLTMCGGGPMSLIGLLAGLVGLATGRPVDRRWWLGCVAANGAGLFINCAGFFEYMAPGC